MPFTFSAGSFSFLKSSTSSQLSIEQNNNVDNVNKHNININDNLDIGNNCLPLGNNFNVIPLERSRSLDNPTSPRNNTGNLKNSNRKAWYKSIFVRIHQTLSPSRWTDDDANNNKINNNSDCRVNNTVDDNNNLGERGDIGSLDDDGPIMMKSRNIVPEVQKNSFVHHGNVHDFYIVTKDYNLKDVLLKRPTRSATFDEACSSSVFEKCAQTPRHFAKETEVLGKVGRFTIVREREDFDTTYFDQCHCQQKPCRFSTNGCSGTHPILPPESLPQLCNNARQQAAAIAHHQMLISSKHHSWSSSSSLKPRRSLYCSPTPSSNSSRHSLPQLQNNANNGACPTPIFISKSTAASAITINSRGVLPQSASSPNLVHLNQRTKSENVNKQPTLRNNNNNNNSRPNSNIIISGKNPTNNGSYYPQCNTNSSMMKKAKKPSLINMKSTEPILLPTTNTPSTPPTPTYPSKFSHHNPNEPHTTINSHTGRKFEVEWSSSSTTASSSSTSSTSSTSSSDPSPSPSSTISSVFSMASSPEKSITNSNTLSRRCSTLSSKCGRKFEVTILSSTNSTNSNGLLNISPQSTISNGVLLNTSPNSTISNGVSSPVEITAANMEFTKC